MNSDACQIINCTNKKIKNLSNLECTIKVPPDKSISHRALMLSAIASQETIINPFLNSNDTLATLDCIKKMEVLPMR